VDDLKAWFLQGKEKLKKCQQQLIDSKNALAAFKAERRISEASIGAEIELLLENYKISRASYHGGDYNGVCCRRLVENAKTIAEKVQAILQSKKDERCDDTTINIKVNELEQLLGLLDAAFAYLDIICFKKMRNKRLGR
jgi:hypothetical protein